MIYNQTKRNLEKSAGIIGIIISSIVILTLFILMLLYASLAIGVSEVAVYTGYRYETEIVYSLLCGTRSLYLFIPIAFYVCLLCFCISIVSNPLQDDGFVKNRNGLRILTIVFSFLLGLTIVAGLMIAFVCIEDDAETISDQIRVPKPSKKHALQSPAPQPSPLTIDGKVNELKHLKELGVIDEETYKKAIEKIINDNI